MDGRNLEVVRTERDLGVSVQENLKWSRQCLQAVSTVNRVLGMKKLNLFFE
jgi:hypothetical protein